MRTVTSPPSIDELVRVHEWECAMRGHSWDVIEAVDVGPVKVICGHCGADSGLVREVPAE